MNLLRPLVTVVIHLALLIAAALSLIPFIWLACASLKRGEDFFTYTFLPWDDLSRLSLESYRQLFTEHPFLVWMLNSLFLASSITVLSVTLSSLVGFALAKYEFAGKRSLMLVMLLTLLLPAQVLIPASYELMDLLGWIDTYRALIVPALVSVLGIFLFRQAMLNVPDELLQAGRVDGCGELRLWWDIALPIVRPMVGAFALVSFLGTWNSFLWPQVILQDDGKYPLTLGLANMLALPGYQAEYGTLMAGTLLSLLPPALLFFALQRDFVAGLTRGAVSG